MKIYFMFYNILILIIKSTLSENKNDKKIYLQSFIKFQLFANEKCSLDKLRTK